VPRPGHRLARLNSLLQAEIADVVRSELKDPRIGFVSVVSVDATGDLRHARVRVSILGTPEEQEGSLEGLVHAAPFIRDRLLHRLDLRRVPELQFILDRNIEYSIHISKVLRDLTPPADDRDR
jgi:ribosome-binding factor A